jgi:hypothetical protein
VWFVDARGCFAGATACADVGVGVGADWVVVPPVAAAVAVVVAAVLAAPPPPTHPTHPPTTPPTNPPTPWPPVPPLPLRLAVQGAGREGVGSAGRRAGWVGGGGALHRPYISCAMRYARYALCAKEEAPAHGCGAHGSGWCF